MLTLPQGLCPCPSSGDVCVPAPYALHVSDSTRGFSALELSLVTEWAALLAPFPFFSTALVISWCSLYLFDHWQINMLFVHSIILSLPLGHEQHVNKALVSVVGYSVPRAQIPARTGILSSGLAHGSHWPMRAADSYAGSHPSHRLPCEVTCSLQPVLSGLRGSQSWGHGDAASKADPEPHHPTCQLSRFKPSVWFLGQVM